MAILKPFFQCEDAEVLVKVSRIMANIASSTVRHCEVLIEYGIHDELGRLLEHPCVDVVGEAVWGLGNIVRDYAENRDAVLRCGIAHMLCAAFERNQMGEVLHEMIAWAILSLTRQIPRPDELYFMPIYKTLRTALSSLESSDRLGSVTRDEWLIDVLITVSNLSDGGVHNVQQCLDFDLPQLVLKLCLQVPVKLPEVSSTVVVQRRVASEQLGEVLSYLPHADLVRLCAVSKDVLIASVCDHKGVYRRLRPNHILATPSLRLEAIHIISNLLSCDDANQTAAGLSHCAVTVLEAVSALPNLSTEEKKENLSIFLSLAASSEEDGARAVLSSDVLLDAIGSAFYSTERGLVSFASSELVKWRDAGVLASLFTKSERFVDKVFIPALAKCLFHYLDIAEHFSLDLRDAYKVFETELPPSRVTAIEQLIELSGLGQCKQQEQLSIVDALWDRETRARRSDASVEDIARRLRVYWGFLQGCWSGAQGGKRRGVGRTKEDTVGRLESGGPCLGFDEAVFLMYQEVYEAINVLNRKREREE